MKTGWVIQLAGAALALCISSIADAQYVPPANIPNVHATQDQFGVNLVTRKIDSQVYGSISIGPQGPGGLSYVWANSMVTGTDANAQLSINGTTYSVVLAGVTRTFTLSGTTYTNNQGTGETLTYNSTTDRYTYTTRNGATLIFGKVVGSAYFPLSLTYPAGETLTWNYDSTTGVTRSVTTNLGYQARPIWDAQGRWSKLVLFDMADETCDPLAVSCTLTGTWPTMDFVAGTINGEPATIWTTNTTTNAVTVTYPTGRTVTYNRDANGRVTSVTDGNGTWTYSWASQFGGPTLINLPGGTGLREVQWNTTTGIIIGDAVNFTGGSDSYSYGYDAQQRVTSVTHNGILTKYTYDARGNITQTDKVSRTPGTPADIITSAAFPASCSNAKTCNQPTSQTDARAHTTDYTYDANSGGVATVTLPAGANGIRPQTRYTYTQVQASYRNGSGTIIQGPPVWKATAISQCATQAGGTCAGTADEVKTSVTYGANDALAPISVSSGSGNGSLTATTAYTYTSYGDVKTINGPLSGTTDTTRFYYDGSRRPTGNIGPDPDGTGSLLRRALRITYNTEGQKTKADVGTATGQADNSLSTMTVLQTISTTYNSQGLKSKQTLNASAATYSVTQYSYTPTRFVDCIAVRMNSATFGSLPSSACTQTTGNPDRITQTVRNAAGLVTQVLSGVGTASPVTTQTNTYSNAILATQADGENNLTTYKYDGFDRLSEIDYPVPTKGSGTSSTTDFEQFGYDPNGNVTSHRLRDATSVSFTYDNLNRKTLKNLPGTEPDVTYAYDNLGRLTSATQTGNSLSFTYDALSRNLTQVGPQGTVTSAWDLAGSRTQLTYPGTGLFVNYDHLLTGEVQKIRENGATTGVGVLATYGYDNLGNRVSIAFGNGELTAYTYDPISRLTSLANTLTDTSKNLTINGFTYSSASQVTSLTRSNDAYAWTGHGNGSTGYTSNGLNQYSAIGGATPTYDLRGNMTTDPTTGKTYAYSSENLLTSASGGVTLAYDPAQRLYQVAGGTTTRFAYDGTDMIAEYNASNVLQRRFVFGPGIDEPIVDYEGADTSSRRWLHSDDEGSIVAITDSSGTTINRYDEYGKPQSTNSGRFQFGGQAWLSEIGLYFLKSRMYAPHLGRFLQTDPIGTQGGINLYAYAGTDPINLRDPLGLQACDSATCVEPKSDAPIIICGNCGWAAAWQNQGLLEYDMAYNTVLLPALGNARENRPMPLFNFAAAPGQSTCTQNRATHEQAVARIGLEYLAQGYVVTPNVTFKNPSSGVRAVADLVVSQPTWPLPTPFLIIEVKTGGGQFSTNQTDVYNLVQSSSGSVIPVGFNALRAGFLPGIEADVGPLKFSLRREPGAGQCGGSQ